MSEWRRRWQIDLRWRAGLGGARVASRRVDTAEQLRAVVMWARRNPDVTGCRHYLVRELVGELPASCRRGHPYGGGSATRAALGWLVCGCGGHAVHTCGWDGCGDRLEDPPLGPDCDPRG